MIPDADPAAKPSYLPVPPNNKYMRDIPMMNGGHIIVTSIHLRTMWNITAVQRMTKISYTWIILSTDRVITARAFVPDEQAWPNSYMILLSESESACPTDAVICAYKGGKDEFLLWNSERQHSLDDVGRIKS